jgi:hypothetical protein
VREHDIRNHYYLLNNNDLWMRFHMQSMGRIW